MTDTDAGAFTTDGLARRCSEALQSGLDERWSNWPLDLDLLQVRDVVGGLLARSVSLAGELGRNPGTWTPHAAPLFLRALADVGITLAWVLTSPVEHAHEFIRHGLGEEKLAIEHIKEQAGSAAARADVAELIRDREDWLASHRFPWLVEVNTGALGGVTVREKARRGGAIELYNLDYQAWSSAAHSNWPFLCRYNLGRCPEPLHRPHFLPGSTRATPHVVYFQRALMLADWTFQRFDAWRGVDAPEPTTISVFNEFMAAADAHYASSNPD